LTGKASCNDIDLLQIVPSALPNVSFPVNVWPMSLEDSGCVVINFYLPFALHSAAFKAQVDATDSGE
jgi:hypothetical protein